MLTEFLNLAKAEALKTDHKGENPDLDKWFYEYSHLTNEDWAWVDRRGGYVEEQHCSLQADHWPWYLYVPKVHMREYED